MMEAKNIVLNAKSFDTLLTLHLLVIGVVIGGIDNLFGQSKFLVY